ncbi:pentatricopeptide repeat-containing protein [Canna indica]|uniref:Pentatricopeptide repeat-containing protein n=1 Tax=Canna indica TaxID=4628 RepID=A0AAQ3QS68_9LILI|nr:pentatricopeptide repeat-containing protein [Canna indica]
MAFLLKPKPPPSSLFPLFLRRLCSSPPCDPVSISITSSTAAGEAAAALEATATGISAESKLLANLHDLIRDHHRANPIPIPSASPPPSDLTIPSLSSCFSNLSPTPPSPSLVTLLVDRCGSLRRGIPFPQILAFFNWWLSAFPSPPPSSTLAAPFNEMIDLCGKLRYFDIAWNLLDKMRALGVPITNQTFSILIRRYVRADLPEDAADAFRRMPDYGCEPDSNTFSSLLAALSKKRLAAKAQSLFDALKHRFPPDVVIYSSLVHAWCRAGKLDEAERVFAEIAANGISPNVYTYTPVIDAMCRAGQIPRANELLCQMIDAGCSPNAATFNSLMRAHVKAGRSEQVLQVNNQMKQLGCEPDIITYNFLIETHCGKGQKNLDAAMKVLNQMSAKGCTPDCHSFNPIFRCILYLRNIGAAHKLYDRMREVGCKPNAVTYNLLIELFSKEKSMDMVLRMKREMEEEGVEPNVNTYGVLITAFCERGHWRQAYGLMKEMLEEKCLKPTHPVYEMVMALLRRAGKLNKHDELMEKMVERGFINRPL